MVTVTVLRPFRDFSKRCDRNAGDTFTATEERARQIDAKLPGYITYSVEMDEPNLAEMTVAQLRSVAKERGVKLAAGAKKAEILDALSKE